MKRQPLNTRLLDKYLDDYGVLIAAHRGLSQGNIVENTIASMRAAFAAGAEIVEMDVIASKDGDFYVFHDGCEARLFGRDCVDIRELSNADIAELTYVNTIGEPTSVGVATLAAFINALPSDRLMNLDRGWPYLQTLLPYLDAFDLTERLILKTRANPDHLLRVAEYPTQYMFFAICRTVAEVELAKSFEKRGLNLVGLELIADQAGHPLLQPACIAALKSQGYRLFVNTLNLGDGIVLWGDYDDDISVIEHPDRGWGKVIKQGIDIIDTDWPALLAQYRSQIRGE